MSICIFGYGSLLNPDSRADTFKEEGVVNDVVLEGYERIANAYDDNFDYLALNLREKSDSSVKGVVVTVEESDMPALIARETGYKLVDVSKRTDLDLGAPLYTFISSQQGSAESVIRLSYLERCMLGVAESEREEWLCNTIMEHEVVADIKTGISELMKFNKSS